MIYTIDLNEFRPDWQGDWILCGSLNSGLPQFQLNTPNFSKYAMPCHALLVFEVKLGNIGVVEIFCIREIYLIAHVCTLTGRFDIEGSVRSVLVRTIIFYIAGYVCFNKTVPVP